MSDDIPFDKSFDLGPETVEEVAPGVRRVLADNPGPFTFKGTVSYIVGRGRVAIIDPGPLDETHIAALLDAVRGETVTHIFVTHTHRDHSPAVPRIKAATGAIVLAEGPHRAARPLHVGEAPRLDASNDTDFRPDRALRDGLGGRVVLDCRVLGDLSVSCSVASETPAGVGFGRAALSASSAYRARGTLSDGASAVGSSARIAVNFQAPQ